jgi:anti-sigma factor RsiW
MKHPAQEEWMDYLYEEVPANDRARLSAHLASCPECRTQLQGWQKTMTRLDTWKPARQNAPVFRWFPVVRWAAAALIMMTFGFALSRMTAPRLDPVALREGVRSEAVAELKQAWQKEMQQLNAKLDQQRTEDQQQVVQTLRQMEAQRLADFASLRYELDTLAMSAQTESTVKPLQATAQVTLKK